MIRIKRTVKLEWKMNPSVFQKKNKDVFRIDTLRVTPTVNAVNAMLACSQELAVLLPGILSKTNGDAGWQNDVQYYFNTMSIPVTKVGLELNIGYRFVLDRTNKELMDNINDYVTSRNIEIDSDLSDYKKEELMAQYISGEKGDSFKCKEEDLYKIVVFENPDHYIKYRFALVNSLVANTPSDANKSENIKFIMTTDELTKAEHSAVYKISQAAFKSYMELCDKSESVIDDYLIAMNIIESHDDLVSNTKDEKLYKLQALVKSDPNTYMSLIKTSDIDIRSKIKKYLWFGILTIIPGTTTIVDAGDQSKVIGLDNTDAILFFKNKLNAGTVEQYDNQYKSLISKSK